MTFESSSRARARDDVRVLDRARARVANDGLDASTRAPDQTATGRGVDAMSAETVVAKTTGGARGRRREDDDDDDDDASATEGPTRIISLTPARIFF